MLSLIAVLLRTYGGEQLKTGHDNVLQRRSKFDFNDYSIIFRFINYTFHR